MNESWNYDAGLVPLSCKAMTVEIEVLRASIKVPDILCRDNFVAARTPMPRRDFSRGYFLMSRTFVICKDATSSLPNLPQGVK
jgi:hypothetical protein